MTILWGVIVGNNIVSGNVSHNSDIKSQEQINAKFNRPLVISRAMALEFLLPW